MPVTVHFHVMNLQTNIHDQWIEVPGEQDEIEEEAEHASDRNPVGKDVPAATFTAADAAISHGDNAFELPPD